MRDFDAMYKNLMKLLDAKAAIQKENFKMKKLLLTEKYNALKEGFEIETNEKEFLDIYMNEYEDTFKGGIK